MKRLIAEGMKVQTCVTSPPYWGLRDYGAEGQIGLERTPQEYIATMVEVFALVRDLLSEDGTLWLNLGDTYATGAGKVGDCPGGGAQGEHFKEAWGYRGGHDASPKHAKAQVPDQKNPNAGIPTFQPNRMPIPGLKPKDLCMIPARVALALQENGWYLRSDIIWDKPNPMPESVEDRPTKSHEYIFLLSKNERYYYDFDAIKEPCQSGPSDIRKMEESKERIGGKHKVLDDVLSKASMHTNIGRKRAVGGTVKSGNKERKCGEERGRPGSHLGGSVPWEGLYRNKRTVWRVATVPYPGSHFATFPPALIEPCILAGARVGDIVFDPFFGSGTTGQVAEQLGRQWIGCEIQRNYEPLQKERTAQRGLAL